jgi:class 3 adenylate cyclase
LVAQTGTVVAGIIGKRKLLYDLYGEAVTTAVAMESTSRTGKIQISEDTARYLQDKFYLSEGQIIERTGEKKIKTFFLDARRVAASPHYIDERPRDRSTSEEDNSIQKQPVLQIANPIYKQLQQEIHELSTLKMNWLTLSFKGKPETEKEFQKYFVKKTLHSIRVAIALIGFVLLLVEVIQLVPSPVRPSGVAAIVLRVTRYAFSIPAAAIVYGLTWVASMHRHMQWLVNIFSAVLYLNWIIAGIFEVRFFLGMAFSHISTFFMLRLYFKYSLLNAGFFQTVFLIIGAIQGFGDVFNTTLVLIVVFIYGALASYMFEKYVRMTFVHEQLLEIEKQKGQIEQAKSEELLVNLLPISIAHDLKRGEQSVASRYQNATIMFAHISGLTKLQKVLNLTELFKLINQLFYKFDDLSERHKLEKIKTIGSTYMVACGLDQKELSKAVWKRDISRVIEMAMDILAYVEEFNKMTLGELTSEKYDLGIRIGIHTGPVVAGVIGKKKFVWPFSSFSFLFWIYFLSHTRSNPTPKKKRSTICGATL